LEKCGLSRPVAAISTLLLVTPAVTALLKFVVPDLLEEGPDRRRKWRARAGDALPPDPGNAHPGESGDSRFLLPL